jgi:hypothetical protein
VAGPAAEIFLINVMHLYHYTDPDFLGIPSWIPWVYFCGAPAVGNLSRAVRRELRSVLALQRPTCEVSVAPAKKAWRPPPRGNARGVRVTSGATAVEQPPRGKMTVLLPQVAGRGDESGGGVSGGGSGLDSGGAAVLGGDNVFEGGVRGGPSSTSTSAAADDGDNNDDTGNVAWESATSRRVRSMRRELEWMRSLQREVNGLQALKQRLQDLRAVASDAAPPMLPILERRLEEVVPPQYRPQLEDTILPAFERSVLPKLPEAMRRRVGKRNPSCGEEVVRLESLRGLNESLKGVKGELESFRGNLDMLHREDPRPPAAAVVATAAVSDYTIDASSALFDQSDARSAGVTAASDWATDTSSAPIDQSAAAVANRANLKSVFSTVDFSHDDDDDDDDDDDGGDSGVSGHTALSCD